MSSGSSIEPDLESGSGPAPISRLGSSVLARGGKASVGTRRNNDETVTSRNFLDEVSSHISIIQMLAIERKVLEVLRS